MENDDKEKPPEGISQSIKIDDGAQEGILQVEEMISKMTETDKLPLEKRNLMQTVLDISKKENVLSKDTLSSYKKLDDITHIVAKLIERRKRFAPKTFVEQAEEAKIGIERRLEDTDKQLNELIQLGSELVTNIRVANEKREVSRRRLEAIKRDELLKDLEKEQIQAVSKFDEINKHWGRLKGIKEPMGLFEEMEEQKGRIAALMKQKDDFIQECQDEIKRVDQRYYEDLHDQSADIYCLVERIDNQIELMKNAYNEHLELLQRTIENERETLALAASRKWEELYRKRSSDENKKLRYQKERAQFYVNEIKRISKEHEDMTRSTRIRLERDAEKLQLELRTVKNNVLLNSEKLDYNYQVLQKRDEENVIIRNQQKRRLAKVNETISNLKKKISSVKINSEMELKKLSREVSQLHANIVDLEGKFKNFNAMNEKKYRAVWDINFQEVMTLLNKVLDIDKILHEQQLGLNWVRPSISQLQLKDLTSKSVIKMSSKLASGKISSKKSQQLFEATLPKTDKQKLTGTRLLRSIIRLVSDRAGFLIEEKLLSILQPHSEELRALVRLDNIFNALNIHNVDDINSLVEYFLPYSWCPNCSKGIAKPVLEKLYDFKIEENATLSKSDTESVDIPTGLSVKDNISGKTSTTIHPQEVISSSSSSEEESEREINKLLTGHDQETEEKICAKSLQLKTSTVSVVNPDCSNHYLVVEPVLVLTALREFAEDNFCGNIFRTDTESKLGRGSVASVEPQSQTIPKGNVVAYWSQFPRFISDQKMKVWKALEHGLNHYLNILKERENLDTQCEFLRRQNAELKHLLQKYLPKLCADAEE